MTGFRPDIRQRAGLTLIEVLLSISVVAILLALIVGGLRASRLRSQAMQDMSRMRALAVLLSQYCAEYQDTFPYYTAPGSKFEGMCGNILVRQPYFGMSDFWHVKFAPWAGLDCADDAFNSARGRLTPSTPFLYSSTLLADPSFWRPETRTGPEQWGPQRIGSVQYPSSKGLLINRADYAGALHPPISSRPVVAYALTDASCRERRYRDFLPFYSQGEGSWDGTVTHLGRPVLHTIGGIAGRDIE